MKGFWVDIIGSPYFAVGIDCETTSKKAESLFEIHNKVCNFIEEILEDGMFTNETK